MSAGATEKSLQSRIDIAAKIPVTEPQLYRQMLRDLNQKQSEIVTFNQSWCKGALCALKQGTPVKPYNPAFLSGLRGIGKSHVIKMIHSDFIRFLKLASDRFQPDVVVALLTDPTGVAAFNINGMALNSGFLLGTAKYSSSQALSHDKLNTLRSRLSNLKLLIINEISMVGSNASLLIHKRLQQIMGISGDVRFRNVSNLAVGDPYQLPPVGKKPLFVISSDGYSQFYHLGSLWQDEFKMHELTQITRQRGDSAFCELLCRARINDCTDEDIEVLKSREIYPDNANYPKQALYVYRQC